MGTRYQIVTEDCRNAGDMEKALVVATYDDRAAAVSHAERSTAASKAAEDEWSMWGEIYWVREVEAETA